MLNVKNYLNFPVVAALMAASSLITSCDSNPIYEDLAPCETRHAIQFRWDNNMLSADAFRGNVHSVAVYGFDKDDKLAFEFAEKGDALAQMGYTLALEGVEPGEYTIVAWCGLDNDTRSESFIVSDTEIGKTSRQELLCRMEREVEGGVHYSRSQLYDLYHGTAYGVEIYPENDMQNQGDHVYTINLTKDTNNVQVLLCQINKDVDVNDFSFRIQETNGLLGCDNELKDDAEINYEPFHTDNAQAGAEATRAAGVYMGYDTAIADLKVSRLMARNSSYLTIENSDGSRVLQVPMIDFALLARPYDAAGFTDQEYLDRQDNYRLVFFLDSEGSWLNSKIIINNWTIYNSEHKFGE